MQDVEARIQGEEERAARNARRREHQRRQAGKDAGCPRGNILVDNCGSANVGPLL